MVTCSHLCEKTYFTHNRLKADRPTQIVQAPILKELPRIKTVIAFGYAAWLLKYNSQHHCKCRCSRDYFKCEFATVRTTNQWQV